jgi:hypothetical protein
VQWSFFWLSIFTSLPRPLCDCYSFIALHVSLKLSGSYLRAASINLGKKELLNKSVKSLLFLSLYFISVGAAQTMVWTVKLFKWAKKTTSKNGETIGINCPRVAPTQDIAIKTKPQLRISNKTNKKIHCEVMMKKFKRNYCWITFLLFLFEILLGASEVTLNEVEKKERPWCNRFYFWGADDVIYFTVWERADVY